MVPTRRARKADRHQRTELLEIEKGDKEEFPEPEPRVRRDVRGGREHSEESASDIAKLK